MKLNRTRLLKALRKAGFEGKTFDDALAFWKSADGPDLTAPGSDKPIDEATFKTAWDTKAVSVLEAEPEADETDIEDDTTVERKNANDRLREKRANELNEVNKDLRRSGERVDLERKSGLKRYDARVARGEKTVFGCGETAEGYVAYSRQLYKHATGKSYAQDAADREILQGLGLATKTTTTFVNTNAGYLVNPLFSNEVLYNTEPYGLAVQIANVQNCSGTDDWSVKRKTGIMSMTHLLEGGTLASGNATYDRVHLIPKTAGVVNDFTQQVLDDAAVNVADEWARSVREARDVRIDNDYFLGDGTATYGGHVGLANALPSGAYLSAAGNNWAAITRKNISDMVGTVENVNLSRCHYVCSRQFYAQVMVPLQGALGGVTSAEGVRGGLAKPSQSGDFLLGTFNGWPVYESQVMPRASGSAVKSLYFGDFIGGSMVGLSKDLEVDVSKEAGFLQYKTYMRAVTRFAINICGDGRTPASTYGNIVCLATT